MNTPTGPTNPVALPEPTRLSPARVQTLLDAGDATPLLPGHLPVPVRIGSWWWHVPLAAAEAEASSHEARYVLASPDQAAAYDRLAARLATAVAAPPPGTPSP